MAGGPIDGNALVVAAAKASISGERLPGLVDRRGEFETALDVREVVVIGT